MRKTNGEIIITKEEKIIKKVLHRLLSEETIKIKKSLERINYLDHQSEHYSDMFEQIQDGVKNDMFNLMEENGWKDWIKELKEELKQEVHNSSHA